MAFFINNQYEKNNIPVKIYNTMGVLLISANNASVDVSNLSKGVYLIEHYGNVQKFICN